MGGRLRRAVLATAIAGTASIVPCRAAFATPGIAPNGCTATAPGVAGFSGEAGCEYIAGTTTGAYAVATPNAWSISVNGVDVASSELGSAPIGSYATGVGDRVTVTIIPVCNPLDSSQCGAIGGLVAGDQ